MNIKSVAMFGATGFSGKVVLEELLARGHHVRALARRPSSLPQHPNLNVIQGDALDAAAVVEVLDATEAVVHCLGVGGKGDGKRTTLVSDSVALVLAALRERDPQRLICMSNVGAGESGTFVAKRLVVPLFFRWLLPIIEDKNRMESLLADSETDWVSLRFPNIVEGPAKAIKTCEHGRATSLTITTGSLAAYLADQIIAERFDLRTPSVSN